MSGEHGKANQEEFKNSTRPSLEIGISGHTIPSPVPFHTMPASSIQATRISLSTFTEDASYAAIHMLIQKALRKLNVQKRKRDHNLRVVVRHAVLLVSWF